jgi:hypothetical protein
VGYSQLKSSINETCLLAIPSSPRSIIQETLRKGRPNTHRRNHARNRRYNANPVSRNGRRPRSYTVAPRGLNGAIVSPSSCIRSHRSVSSFCICRFGEIDTSIPTRRLQVIPKASPNASLLRMPIPHLHLQHRRFRLATRAALFAFLLPSSAVEEAHATAKHGERYDDHDTDNEPNLGVSG